MRKWIAVILTVLLLLPACALAAELKITELSSGVKVTPTMYGYELKDGKEYLIEGSSNGGIMLDITGNVTVVLKGVNLKDSLDISTRALGEKQVTLRLTGDNYISAYDQPAILVMADKCALNIEESSGVNSLTLRSDKNAGIQSTSKVYLNSSHIDIQGGSGKSAITAALIEWNKFNAYPKVRVDYGDTWMVYPTSPMGKLFTTREVGAYNLVIHRETTSRYLNTPGTTLNFSTGTKEGYAFKRWESPQESEINAANPGFSWTAGSLSMLMPACDVELYAVWEKMVEGSISDVGSLTVQVTPYGAGNVVGTIGGGLPFVADGTTDYLLGTTVKLEAKADAQFEFVNWSVEGDAVISENPVITEEVKGDRTLYANFRERKHEDTVLITKKVEGDLDSSVSAEPIEYVYVWGDEASVWGFTTVVSGYTAVDVSIAGGTKTETVTVKVSPDATWYVVGEVLDAGKVTGYTCEAKAVSAEFGSADDNNAYKTGSLPLGLGAGDDDGAVWMASAIRTDPDYPVVNVLPEVLPEFTFLNTYEKEEETPADPVIPEEFDVTITKKIEGIDPADLPEGTMFNFKFDSLDGKQNLGEVKFTKNDLLRGERSKPIGKLPKDFEISENGSDIPGYDVKVNVTTVGVKCVEEGDEEGSLGKFEVDTVPFEPDVPTNSPKARTAPALEIIVTNTYTPIDPSQDVPADINMPQTGDESDIMLWLSLAMTSMAALVLVSRKKREA